MDTSKRNPSLVVLEENIEPREQIHTTKKKWSMLGLQKVAPHWQYLRSKANGDGSHLCQGRTSFDSDRILFGTSRQVETRQIGKVFWNHRKFSACVEKKLGRSPSMNGAHIQPDMRSE